MTIFDQFVFNVFHYYKPKLKKRANRIAIIYISILQSALILLFGVFFAAFFKQMHVTTMSSTKAWTLFVMVVLAVFFKNWMQYSGRKRKILNAKLSKGKSRAYNIWVLWFLPLACVFLALLLHQKV
jgi:ABC-type uncharacterized transport system YnjBCD permease subunit